MIGRRLLAPPKRTRLRWAPEDPPPVSDRAPELRARHRAEAVAAFTTTREEEIDPVPSSRPSELQTQGYPWAPKEGAT